MSRSGYVLVGGRSRRMGRDKATLPWRDSTLSQSIAEAVKAAAGSATLVGNPELGGIPDAYPGEGPLGGILTALEHSQAEWNLIVACDMPALRTDFLVRLLNTAEQSGCDVLVPVGPKGVQEPLCAVYAWTARPAIEGAFALGIRKITSAFDGLVVRRLDVGEAAWFQNVNTPEDWEPYAAG